MPEKDLQFIRSLMTTPLGQVLERINQVFWVCSADLSETLYVSPAYEEIWGRPTQNLYERPESFTDPICPEDRQRVLAAIEGLLNGVEMDEEYRIARPDGSIRWIHDRAFGLRDSSGQLYCLAGIAEDITERKQAEVALRESELHLRLALNAAQLGTWDWNLETNVVTWSERTEEIFGYAPGTFPGTYEGFIDRVHPEDRSRVAQECARSVSDLIPCSFEYRLLLPDGTVRWVAEKGEFLFDEAGQPRSLGGVMMDITERKIAEEALRSSEEQFRRVFDEAPIGMALTGSDGRFFKANRVFQEMLGYSESELMPFTCANITHPEDLKQEIPYIQQVKRGEIDRFQLETRFFKKNQEIVWVNLTLMMLRGKAGEILYTLGMIEDITERKLAVEALRDSEQQYRQLAENIGHVTWLITPDTKQLFYISPNYEQVWGKSCASLYEKPLSFMDIIHPEDKEKAVAALELDSTRMDLEYRIIRSDGTMRWIHVRTHPVLNETGEIYRVVGIAEDITVCKIAEEEILKALQREQELSEAKSRFIAMTSHDLRTPLTTIQSSVDLLKHRSEKLSPERQLLHLDRISSATEQMTSMVQDVLLLSEAEAGNLQFNPALVDLAQLCRSVVADLEVAHKNQHIVEFAVSDEYGTRDLLLDSKLVRYILINLLTNAFKYSRQGSTIQLHLICHPESVVLRIQNQGIGIPAQDIPRLFESFYRASNAGMVQGTGLGLAIVKQCVDLHGGKITVDSAVGKGATFTVTLPLINNGIHSSKIL